MWKMNIRLMMIMTQNRDPRESSNSLVNTISFSFVHFKYKYMPYVSPRPIFQQRWNFFIDILQIRPKHVFLQ